MLEIAVKLQEAYRDMPEDVVTEVDMAGYEAGREAYVELHMHDSKEAIAMLLCLLATHPDPLDSIHRGMVDAALSCLAFAQLQQ